PAIVLGNIMKAGPLAALRFGSNLYPRGGSVEDHAVLQLLDPQGRSAADEWLRRSGLPPEEGLATPKERREGPHTDSPFISWCGFTGTRPPHPLFPSSRAGHGPERGPAPLVSRFPRGWGRSVGAGGVLPAADLLADTDVPEAQVDPGPRAEVLSRADEGVAP